MKFQILCLALWANSASALIGYGIAMYNPTCAFACRAIIAGATLDCTDPHAGHGGHSHGGGGPTSPECRASDSYFLTTLANCIKLKCESFDIDAWRLEKYFRQHTTGDPAVSPKWSWAETLQNIEGTPDISYDAESTLNYTAVLDDEAWQGHYNTLKYFEWQESTHSKYG